MLLSVFAFKSLHRNCIALARVEEQQWGRHIQVNAQTVHRKGFFATHSDHPLNSENHWTQKIAKKLQGEHREIQFGLSFAFQVNFQGRKILFSLTDRADLSLLVMEVRLRSLVFLLPLRFITFRRNAQFYLPVGPRHLKLQFNLAKISPLDASSIPMQRMQEKGTGPAWMVSQKQKEFDLSESTSSENTSSKTQKKHLFWK